MAGRRAERPRHRCVQLFACFFFLTAGRNLGFKERLGICVATHERFCQGTGAVGMRSKRDVVRHPKGGCVFVVRPGHGRILPRGRIRETPPKWSLRTNRLGLCLSDPRGRSTEAEGTLSSYVRGVSRDSGSERTASVAGRSPRPPKPCSGRTRLTNSSRPRVERIWCCWISPAVELPKYLRLPAHRACWIRVIGSSLATPADACGRASEAPCRRD